MATLGVYYAHFVHCATHHLNIVLKEAVSFNIIIDELFETVQSVHNSFERVISERLGNAVPTLKI